MLTIQRLAGTPKLKSYNLFEHSFGVLVLFRIFAERENIDYDLNVLDIIMNHDSPEVLTGDLIYTVKNFNSVTSENWSSIEHELTVNTEFEKYSDENIIGSLTETQFFLFKCCDILDLYIFLCEEYQLGNRSKELIDILHRCHTIIWNYKIHFESIISFMSMLKNKSGF